MKCNFLYHKCKPIRWIHFHHTKCNKNVLIITLESMYPNTMKDEDHGYIDNVHLHLFSKNPPIAKGRLFQWSSPHLCIHSSLPILSIVCNLHNARNTPIWEKHCVHNRKYIPTPNPKWCVHDVDDVMHLQWMLSYSWMLVRALPNWRYIPKVSLQLFCCNHL